MTKGQHGTSTNVIRSAISSSSSTISSPKEKDQPISDCSLSPDKIGPVTHHYDNDRLFQTALQLFNKQMERLSVEGDSSQTAQRWECKGQVQASFQMCVSCRDVGKVKTFRERYYLDVLEVRKYRTILCRRCMGCVLKENIGRN